MKLDDETLLEKVVHANYIIAVSDNHDDVMRAIKARAGYELIAKESGIDTDQFKTKCRERYLERVFENNIETVTV